MWRGAGPVRRLKFFALGKLLALVDVADYSRKSFEKSSQAFQTATAAKSLDKVIEVQQSYAKEAYESFLGQVNKVGELYLAAAKDAYKPFESKFAEMGVKVPK
jgi:hypothetical protein